MALSISRSGRSISLPDPLRGHGGSPGGSHCCSIRLAVARVDRRAVAVDPYSASTHQQEPSSEKEWSNARNERGVGQGLRARYGCADGHGREKPASRTCHVVSVCAMKDDHENVAPRFHGSTPD